MVDINIEPIVDEEVGALGEAVEITEEETPSEGTVTVTIGDEDFELINPVIVNTIFDYNDDNTIMKTEVEVNSVLVGGGEEKRESEFFYNENGKLIKEVETSSEGVAESIIEYDENDRVIKVETPLSIIENNYIDDDNYVTTTKNKLKEIYTVDTYKKYGDDKFELINSVTKDVNDELLSETIREIDEAEDRVKISTRNITKTEDGKTAESKNSAICEYKSGLILSSDNIDYALFTNAHIEFIRNEKNQLVQLVVSTPDGETKIIQYEIKDNEEDNSYTTTSKYESIYVKETEDISVMENTLFDGGPVAFSQSINSKGYSIDCNINNIVIDNSGKLYQLEAIKINNKEEGLYIKTSRIVDRQEDNKLVKKAIDATFKFDGKVYSINNDMFGIYTKVAVGNIVDNNVENQTEVNVKSTDNKELVDYISSKLKEYVESNDDLKSLLDIAKVGISF